MVIDHVKLYYNVCTYVALHMFAFFSLQELKSGGSLGSSSADSDENKVRKDYFFLNRCL